MERHDKNIDDLFKEELGSYTEAPPPAAWDALEKKLDNRPPRPGYRNLVYLAGLLLLVSLGVSVARMAAVNPETQSSGTAEKTAAMVQESAPATTGAPLANAEQDKTAGVTAVKNTSNPGSEPGTAVTNTSNREGDPGATAKQTSNPGSGPATVVQPSFVNKPAAVKKLLTSSPSNTLSAAAAKKTTPAAAPMTVTQPASGPSAGEPAEQVVPQATAETKPAPAAAIVKKDSTKPASAAKAPQKAVTTSQKPDQVRVKPNFDRIEAGIKGGYEKSFSTGGATKFLASPYLQYNLSPKFAVMTQPAIKVSTISSQNIGVAQSYYKVNNDGTTRFADSTLAIIPLAGRTDSMWLRDYYYRQTYESVVKTNTFGGSYVEFDIPVLVKYAVTPKFSVYGGANISYNKLININEHTYTSAPIAKMDSAITLAPLTAPAPLPPALTSVIRYSGNSYSNYTGPQYPTGAGGVFRLGYMAGFSYEFANRWLFDGLVQQGTAKSKVVSTIDINKSFSVPYFRFTLGYKIIK